MSLIAMCSYATEENDKLGYLKQTLRSLTDTEDLTRHRLFIINNSQYIPAIDFIDEWRGKHHCTVFHNDTNLGTARGINLALTRRNPGEPCIKSDDDVVWYQTGWIEEMEEALLREPSIGILGLKRKDIDFDTNHENPNYRSQLIQLPHERGQTWITVEKGPYIMGTCTMFGPALLDRIGYMEMPGAYYGLDDTLFSLRSTLAGFWNVYLPHINIDHVDPGGNSYVQFKQQQAASVWDKYTEWHKGYIEGTRSLYYDGGFTG